MPKINWSQYVQQRIRPGMTVADAERLDQFGTTTEEDLAAVQASETPGPQARFQERVGEPWYDSYGNQVNLSTLGLGTVAENRAPNGYSYITGKRGETYTTLPNAGRSKGIRAARQSIRR